MNEAKSETKHTPGPWAIDEGLTTRMGGPRIIAPASKEAIADLWETSRVGTSAEANARHIAACVNACEGINPEAVPDLIWALKNIVEATTAFSWPRDIDRASFLKAARAAIAKAEGK